MKIVNFTLKKIWKIWLWGPGSLEAAPSPIFKCRVPVLLRTMTDVQNQTTLYLIGYTVSNMIHSIHHASLRHKGQGQGQSDISQDMSGGRLWVQVIGLGSRAAAAACCALSLDQRAMAPARPALDLSIISRSKLRDTIDPSPRVKTFMSQSFETSAPGTLTTDFHPLDINPYSTSFS